MNREIKLHIDVARKDFALHPSTGFLIATARATRTGVFDYSDGKGGTIRELRPEDEVFHPDSLESLKFAPITRHHPDEMVTVDNVDKFMVGIIGENVHRDGEFVSVPLVIKDKKEIKRIQDARAAGKPIELSCGYDAKVVAIAGEHPKDGHYDCIQTQIRYNHLSTVDRGRAGKEVKIIFDEADSDILDFFDADNKPKRPAQTIIISKEIASTLEAAKKIAAELGEIKKSEETSTSFRFRQIEPGRFKEGSFRTFSVPGKKGVSLVFGTLKKQDSKEVVMKIKKDAIVVGKFNMDTISGEVADDNGVVSRLSDKFDEAVIVMLDHESEKTELTKKADELQGKLDAGADELKKVQDELDSYKDPNSDKIEALLAVKKVLLDTAEALEVKTKKEDGTTKSTKELKVDIISASSSEKFDSEGRTDTYIDARCDQIVELVAKSDKEGNKSKLNLAVKKADDTKDGGEEKTAREKFLDAAGEDGTLFKEKDK